MLADVQMFMHRALGFSPICVTRVCFSSVSTLCLFLLSLSFSAQTEKGSALHEAALFGKTDVVQRLLCAGQTFDI